jgi:methanethiol S-methyltransferase
VAAIPATVWQIDHPQIAMAVTGFSLVGWLIVFPSTFLINPLELFGLRQVAYNLAGCEMLTPRFRTPLYYKYVWDPTYLGFIVAFRAAPTVSVGHLRFAAAIRLHLGRRPARERDLVDHFGDDYRRYKAKVSMLLP